MTGIIDIAGAASGGPVAITIESVLELLTALAQLGASPAVQQSVLTWLKERAGADNAIIEAALAKNHEQPEPKEKKL